MTRVAVEVLAICAAAIFVALITRVHVSEDENVVFFLALIGSLTAWEGVRFLLTHYVGKTND